MASRTCMRRCIFRAASHPSHMVVANPAASPRRTRVTHTVKRRKVTSWTGWSLNPVAKLLLRSRSKRVRIVINALLDPVQKAVMTIDTRSQRNAAKSHISPIRSCISRHGSIQFQARFLTVLLFLIKYTVNHC